MIAVKEEERSSRFSDASEDGDAGVVPTRNARKFHFNGRIMQGASRWRGTNIIRRSFSEWISLPRTIMGTMVAGIIVIIVLITLVILSNINLRGERLRDDLKRAKEMQSLVASWNTVGLQTQDSMHYPTDFSRDVTPIPCHSHNDYWRTIPLFEGLAAGCTGTEADVWLEGNSILVGHTKGSLTPARSLESLYINPILSILDHQNSPSKFSNTSTKNSLNGVFETSPQTTLTLLIDMKTDGAATLPAVLLQVEPLRSRNYLTYFNGSTIIPGPITVVGTGNTPFSALTANNTYRDIFFDAPLEQLWGENAPSNNTLYTSSNSYYTSVSFAKAIGKPWHGILTPDQVDTIRGQVKAAKARGLKARYWDTPAWPISVRDHVWDVLEKEGVGMLNVDDVIGASWRRWGG